MALTAGRVAEPPRAGEDRGGAKQLGAKQLGLIWGAVALALVLASPFADRLATATPSCPIKIYADLPCPGCGATRTALALRGLDLLAALRVSPLATLAWVGFILGGFVAGGAALVGRPLREPSWNWPLSVRLGLFAMIFANWLYLVWAGT